MGVTKEKKQAYINDLLAEMRRRGFSEEETSTIIGKTGFMEAIEKYPEE
ncbi:hypothetical protein [Pseudobutyrivibrio sp.]|nr:hypothetical protein [Pseudobutyrivibrio sp.]